MKNITFSNILAISRLSNTFRREHLQDVDLNPALYLYISYINNHPGCRQEEFIEKFCLDKTTVAHQLNRLEQLGYIERLADPQDGRCRLVYLKEKGKEIYPMIHQSLHEFINLLFDGLTEEEKQLLDQLTTKLVINGKKAIQ